MSGPSIEQGIRLSAEKMAEEVHRKQGLRVRLANPSVRWLELGAGHKFAVAPHAAALQLVEGLVADARENAEALQEAERPAPGWRRRERAHGAVRPARGGGGWGPAGADLLIQACVSSSVVSGESRSLMWQEVLSGSGSSWCSSGSIVS